MKSIGLDIGTTTICGIVMEDKTGKLLDSQTISNKSVIKSKNEWEKLQNPNTILNVCKIMTESFLKQYSDINKIGITGQMHGILYVDAKGMAVSPLYSWQDQRGNLEYKEGHTYSEYLTEATGYEMATGFGITTHFYNQQNHCIPQDAISFCTIPDYIAMSFAKLLKPHIHASMAASLGLFCQKEKEFDKEALEKLGLDSSLFPKVDKEEKTIGIVNNIAIFPALGDNQASFLGSVSAESNILVNVGTGSQISILTDSLEMRAQVECRPYINQKYLMVGSPLFGGASYALLKDFFMDTVKLFGYSPMDASYFYEYMNEAAKSIYKKENKVIVNTKFAGTRKNPKERGTISNLSAENVKPEAFILGMLQGICNELYEIYELIPEKYKEFKVMTASGNGIRKNSVLQQICEDTFEKKLMIPVYAEEASYGSALFALYCSEETMTMKEIQLLVKNREVY